MTSDQIAALALIVSIAGFWVAYKSWYQSRKLIVAEKCTQVWHALVEARLVLLNLHFVIREIASIFSALESAGRALRRMNYFLQGYDKDGCSALVAV